MNAEDKDVRVVAQNCCVAVALVNIEVDNGDFPDPALMERL